MYQDIQVHICVGDKLATHIVGRLPTYLNVVIIHRSGIVCCSWYENANVIFNPYENDSINDNKILILKK